MPALQLVDNLLQLNANGLYCAPGDFYIDPWNPVERAVITHAHADHLCAGSKSYLCARPCEPLLRVGVDAAIESLAYGEARNINGVRVSFHPAGHILGSAQVRIEYQGQIWVVSGDYKLAPDPTCAGFEPVQCHTFITESTFGLPIFRWPEPGETLDEINAWWRANQQAAKASVLFAYPLGKAQRVLAGIDSSIGPIYTHGAVEQFNGIYRDGGIALPLAQYARSAPPKTDWTRTLILAPPMAKTAPWLRPFGDFSTGMASGWMRIRGTRRRRSIDRGFVLSDHADWPALLSAIRGSGAQRVWVTHGYRAPLARWLAENGVDADAVETRFTGEQEAEVAGEAEA
ncbi:MAG: ligase-associated DNA damage response exonuclease [Acidobacteria bacterium]|nr:MAG: ligase-associated DNA damage response exonuclease [Acidobacteriota bacterium]